MPIFLTCAVLGNFTTRGMNENLPITPAEIAGDCLAAAEAGAAIVHIHVRDPQTQEPSMETSLYREVVERIRARNQSLIINLTTGNGGRYQPSEANPAVAGPRTNLVRPEIRVRHVLEIRPDIASLDLNTMVFGNEVVINTPSSVREMARLIQGAGVRPEVELFDSGDIQFFRDLVSEGAFVKPPICSIVTGVKYGFGSSPETVLYARDLLPEVAAWTAFGTGRAAFPMVAQSLLAGGHARIGMEDAVWLDHGVKAPSNAAMVLKARRMIEDLGQRLMSAEAVRDLLEL